MKVIEIVLEKSEFSDDASYKIVFNDKFETDISTKSYQPLFTKRKFEILSSNFKEMKEVLTVTIISLNGDKETIRGKESLELAYGKESVSNSVEFNKTKGASVDGVVHFSYKLYKQTLPESLKNTNGICCLSINASYLNLANEKPFDLKLLIKDHTGAVLGTARLNNRSPVFYLDMDRSSTGEQPLELVVSDSSRLYSIVVRPNHPVASAIPLSTGDSLLLTSQLVTGVGVVTGMLHSSALREASVSTTTAGKRISLSPRRPSVMLSVGGGVPGGGELNAKKSLLFLEDAFLHAGSESTSPSAVLEGVQQAISISVADSQAPLSNERLASPVEGPRGGAYVTCTSKNEILLDSAADAGKKKSSKKNKRQLHVVNLGLVSVHGSGLLSPVKLRAELLDYLMEPHGVVGSSNNSPVKQPLKGASIEMGDNPEDTAPPPNITSDGASLPLSSPRTAVLARPTLAYSGLLEETSRELFNESGFIAVVLEGKLFRQSSHGLQSSSVPNSRLGGSNSSPRGSVVGAEETCMVVKVYLSLVPSSPPVDQRAEKALPAVDQASSSSLSESVSEKDIFAIDSEILDFGGYALSRAKRLEAVNESEAFNVTTASSALPDELLGSSVLTVPLAAAEMEKETVKKEDTSKATEYGSLEKATSAAQFGETLDPKHLLHLQQLELEDQQRSRMIASNNAFAEIVRAELVEKQRLVEKLMAEVKVRSEAIQVVGRDIRELRQEKVHLLDKIQSLENDLARKEKAEQSTNAMTERMLKSSAALQDMDRDTLIRLLNQLRDALNASEGEKVQLQSVLRSAKTSIDEFAVMKRDYRELQGAHTDQTKYLQKMQTKINQTDVYRGTIATQEGVISSMQSAIEAKIHKHRGLDKQLLLPRPPKRVAALDSLSSGESSVLAESKLREASLQVSTLEQRVRELEEQLELAKYSGATSDEEKEEEKEEEIGSDYEEEEEEEEEDDAKKPSIRPLETNRKIDQLEAELVSKGFRISALEKQLETSTVEYSREIARLRTKLFELEINSSLMAGDLDGGEGDQAGMDGFLMDEFPDSDSLSDLQIGDRISMSRADNVVNSGEYVPFKVDDAQSAAPTMPADDSSSVSPLPPTGADPSTKSISDDLNASSTESSEDVEPISKSADVESTIPVLTVPLVVSIVERVVEKTITIHDIVTEGVGAKCADLTFKIRHLQDPETKTSRFIFQYLELHGFAQSEEKKKFQPHVVLSMPSADWTDKTEAKSEPGDVVWEYSNEEKCLTMTDDQLERGDVLQIKVNKFSAKSHSDFLIGTGSLSMKF